jgi:hypothetical protein
MKSNMRRRRRKKRIIRTGLRLGALAAVILVVMTAAAIWMQEDGGTGNWQSKSRRAVDGIIRLTDVWELGAGSGNSTGSADIENPEDYPESLLDLYERNPEAAQFVLDYPEKGNLHETIDISDEVTMGTIPLFLQWDERWGYEMYGDDFLAVTGCGPTCLSMVYCGLTQNTDWNPYQMAQEAEREGYYVSGTGSAWNMMTELAGELGLTAKTVIFDEDHIKEELNAGRPIICAMGPGDFTTTGHFIVLTGVNADGSIVVNDPNSKENSGADWELSKIMSQIRNLWSYSYEG